MSDPEFFPGKPFKAGAVEFSAEAWNHTPPHVHASGGPLSYHVVDTRGYDWIIVFGPEVDGGKEEWWLSGAYSPTIRMKWQTPPAYSLGVRAATQLGLPIGPARPAPWPQWVHSTLWVFLRRLPTDEETQDFCEGFTAGQQATEDAATVAAL